MGESIAGLPVVPCRLTELISPIVTVPGIDLIIAPALTISERFKPLLQVATISRVINHAWREFNYFLNEFCFGLYVYWFD